MNSKKERNDEVLMKIKYLESDEIKKIKDKESEEVDYYLETSDLLNEYYSRKDGTFEETNKELSVLIL